MRWKFKPKVVNGKPVQQKGRAADRIQPERSGVRLAMKAMTCAMIVGLLVAAYVPRGVLMPRDCAGRRKQAAS